MEKGCFLLLFVFGTLLPSKAATVVASGGEWSAGASWVGGAAPVSGVDDVYIPPGITITITTAVVVYNGAITIDGTLSFLGTFGRLSMNGSSTVTINAGGSITAAVTLPALTGIRVGFNIVAYNAAIDGSPVPGPATISLGGLPITLIYFEGETRLDLISLSWATSSEENFSHFVLEKSNDGINFSRIGEQASLGGLELTTEYSFEDILPFEGLNYYRLKAVDYDGSFEYSDIISIQSDASGPDMLVYPNPVSTSFRLSLNFVPEKEGVMELYNFMGNKIFSRTVSDFQTEIMLPEGLNRGTYMLHVRFNEMTTSTRILVE